MRPPRCGATWSSPPGSCSPSSRSRSSTTAGRAGAPRRRSAPRSSGRPRSARTGLARCCRGSRRRRPSSGTPDGFASWTRPATAGPRSTWSWSTTRRSARSASSSPACWVRSQGSRPPTTSGASSRSSRPGAFPRPARPSATTSSASDRRSHPSSPSANPSPSSSDQETAMRATTWQGNNDVEVRDVPDPTILDSRDAIVRITSTAICGSDLHLLQGFVPSMMKGDIMGHEFMGELVDVGPDVTNAKVGDRVVVPFPIACGSCWSCRQGLFSVCENTNPNAGLAEKFFGFPTAGVFGYSHLTGGYPGGQAEYARIPFADVNTLPVPAGVPDEQVLFLSDIFPTGYMGADFCQIKGGDVVAVWGAGPVGQFAIASAKLLGAERVIAIDRFDYRLAMATERAGADDVINYERQDVTETLRELTGGRGPDAAIDAVGMEAHSPRPDYLYDKAKQVTKMETDRPLALREAILNVRSGGTVSVVGVYGGFIDKFPMGAVMNRGLTIKAAQCPVQHYWKDLLQIVEDGRLDPTFVITHELPL